MAKIVAVMACPTGIAHTVMAAEALEKTAKIMGHTLRADFLHPGHRELKDRAYCTSEDPGAARRMVLWIWGITERNVSYPILICCRSCAT